MIQQLGGNVTCATEDPRLRFILVTLLIVLLHWFEEVSIVILEQTFNPDFIGVFFAQRKVVERNTHSRVNPLHEIE